MPPQQGADRGGGDRVPQLEQLAAAPLIAPAWVLLRELQDQVPRSGREWGASRPTAPAERGPLAADQLAVPAEEGLWPDGERMPVGAGKATTEGSEDQSVARAPGDALRPAPQDAHFVAQGEELEVADGTAPAPEQGEVQEQEDKGIQD